MTDCYDTKTRRKVMQEIHSRHTRPEVRVRSILHRMGYRFRLHRRDIPGTPDIVLFRYRTVILVNGCFWHQHSGCKLARRPKSNQEFWNKKLEDNIARDARIIKKLRAYGWRVLVIWECQVNRKKKAPDFMRALMADIGLFTCRKSERYTQLKLFQCPDGFKGLKHSSMV